MIALLSKIFHWMKKFFKRWKQKRDSPVLVKLMILGKKKKGNKKK